ncbi:SGNH/GDSL hydrolase family protein [Pseudoalteromonas denitrificans]|uniref:Lysophospholipase L1 n=1 Tax=Pseudoalteromonas denitrificans DSM 6059 TaxID=1123010 RepID=A0A1I1KWQ0_9GAMM|nr:SGNH/GDSL hydrolase family protein [Pseudoalteromonas denitrificans]SFC62563.1 Lysophospholipase L1 [Pseudoalteromonas denitrificans DSM 6059]
MKNILCFGDSNTWGYTPLTTERYPLNIRWTGVLQSLLGEGFCIIEEGLNGRTCIHDDPTRTDRNGIKLLPSILKSNSPLDLVIIMLGTNDLKASLKQTAYSISLGAKLVCESILNSEMLGLKNTQILLISPSHVEIVPEEDKDEFAHAYDMSRKLSQYYSIIAKELDIHFYNAAKIVKTSKLDGVHWDGEQHIFFAEQLSHKIHAILS